MFEGSSCFEKVPRQRAGIDVSEAEGPVLALLADSQPLTRYQIVEHFRMSPVKPFNASRGSVYPLIGRLIRRGFLQCTNSAGHRGEVYSLTLLGRRALRDWTMRPDARGMLPLDPLERRLFSVALLEPSERYAWIAKAKQLVFDKKLEAAAHHARSDRQQPYGQILHKAENDRLDQTLLWLDMLLIEVARELEIDQGKS